MFEVTNENGERFGGPFDTHEKAENDRQDCETLYDGDFYVQETD